MSSLSTPAKPTTRQDAYQALDWLESGTRPGTRSDQALKILRRYVNDKEIEVVSAMSRSEGAQEATQRKLDAATILCRIYFDIAADALGEDEVRRRRDEAIAARDRDSCPRDG